AFESTNDSRFMIRTFLVRFDAIFTLNQDLLLERHYLDDNVALSSARRWSGWQMPGLKLLHPNTPYFDPNLAKIALRAPDSSAFQEQGGSQPYYKLHGSSNWHSNAGERMLIMGSRIPSFSRDSKKSEFGIPQSAVGRISRLGD